MRMWKKLGMLVLILYGNICMAFSGIFHHNFQFDQVYSRHFRHFLFHNNQWNMTEVLLKVNIFIIQVHTYLHTLKIDKIIGETDRKVQIQVNRKICGRELRHFTYVLDYLHILMAFWQAGWALQNIEKLCIMNMHKTDLIYIFLKKQKLAFLTFLLT